MWIMIMKEKLLVFKQKQRQKHFVVEEAVGKE
jgi:hypothetical protein